jgi:hypothetical protein
MISSLRVMRLLAMVVWVGGLVFFAFAVAPVSFDVLPTRHLAGLVVAGTLAELHQIGVICGLLWIAATSYLFRAVPPQQRRLITTQVVCVGFMMLATFYVKDRIVPAMNRDLAAAGGDIDAVAPDNPARVDFERLHPISEKVEGAALFLGLGVVVLMGLEGQPNSDTQEAIR